ncbi:hypothetical protein IMZ31_20275 (plasmid) [Pontibacillus sp. ALD_SL1]|uniref:hypothetical protein n=1 Tax=Pontibacillus sp. ALD_SL1 TaxID=2777185 RepID=UPI001A979E4F|nr:hypothetical protein [Pontibacillus sp. ALD_SL1]QST02887.1 hypothetical protein IMZ31_20275 [Pontibacillus sp. ALD_SL1]
MDKRQVPFEDLINEIRTVSSEFQSHEDNPELLLLTEEEGEKMIRSILRVTNEFLGQFDFKPTTEEAALDGLSDDEEETFDEYAMYDDLD